MDKSRLVSVALSIRAVCAKCAVKWRALPARKPKTLPGIARETAQRVKDSQKVVQEDSFLFFFWNKTLFWTVSALW